MGIKNVLETSKTKRNTTATTSRDMEDRLKKFF